MDKPSSKTTHVFNPPLSKSEGYQPREMTLIQVSDWITKIPKKFNSPEAQFAVHQCVRFSSNPKLLHGQPIKQILEYLMGMYMQGLIINPTQKRGYSVTLTTTSPEMKSIRRKITRLGPLQCENCASVMLPLCYRYVYIMLMNEGGTNHMFENRDTCVWLARAQERAIIAIVQILT